MLVCWVIMLVLGEVHASAEVSSRVYFLCMAAYSLLPTLTGDQSLDRGQLLRYSAIERHYHRWWPGSMLSEKAPHPAIDRAIGQVPCMAELHPRHPRRSRRPKRSSKAVVALV